MAIRRWVVALGVALAGALVGCLDFDEQTVYFEHDQQNDRLVMVINYLGLYSGSPGLRTTSEQTSDPAGFGETQTQLADAIQKQTVALCGNWPWLFPVREWREQLADPEAEEMKDVPQEIRRNAVALLDHVRVLNGGFYEDPAGRICGGQVVVVENATEAVRLGNELISAALLRQADQAAPDDPEEKVVLELALKAAADGHQWLTLDGHSLVVAVPMPEHVLQTLREDLVRGLSSPGDENLALRLRGIGKVLSNPVLLWHEDGMMKVRVGLVTAPSVFVAKPSQGKYAPNLVDHITATYGLHLDEHLARYLVEPAAPAEAEAERAALVMAPRLPKPERIRLLVGQLKAAPSDALRAKLREEGTPEQLPEGAPLPSDDELLQLWQTWLKQQAGAAEGTGEGPASAGPGEQ